MPSDIQNHVYPDPDGYKSTSSPGTQPADKTKTSSTTSTSTGTNTSAGQPAA